MKRESILTSSLLGLLGLTGLFAQGCGGPVSALGGGGRAPVGVELILSSKSAEAASGATQATETVTGFGTIKGKIVLTGGQPTLAPLVAKGTSSDPICKVVEVPDQSIVAGPDGGLANVVVFLRKAPKMEIPAPPEEAVEVDQDGCKFLPHVSLVRVGQKLHMKNGDATPHNVQSPYFNDTIAPKDEKGLTFVPKNAESLPMPIACSIHAWMKGYVAVVNHPWAVVTGPDGTFEIKGVPAGEREFVVWHEKGTLERGLKIKVTPDGVTEVPVIQVAADKFK